VDTFYIPGILFFHSWQTMGSWFEKKSFFEEINSFVGKASFFLSISKNKDLNFSVSMHLFIHIKKVVLILNLQMQHFKIETVCQNNQTSRCLYDYWIDSFFFFECIKSSQSHQIDRWKKMANVRKEWCLNPYSPPPVSIDLKWKKIDPFERVIFELQQQQQQQQQPSTYADIWTKMICVVHFNKKKYNLNPNWNFIFSFLIVEKKLQCNAVSNKIKSNWNTFRMKYIHIVLGDVTRASNLVVQERFKCLKVENLIFFLIFLSEANLIEFLFFQFKSFYFLHYLLCITCWSRCSTS